jgi:hypothetical protein
MRSTHGDRPTFGGYRALTWTLAVVAVAIASTAVPVPPASARGGQWVWPLSPRPAVVHGFDAPDPDWLPGHRGVDLAGRVGQPVLAIGAGRVSFAGPIAGMDVLVVVHGRLRSTYQPVLPLTEVGAKVAAGHQIGTLEVTGSHCLPAACLHLGVREGATYVDPLSLFGPQPVRLLPLGGSAATWGRFRGLPSGLGTRNGGRFASSGALDSLPFPTGMRAGRLSGADRAVVTPPGSSPGVLNGGACTSPDAVRAPFASCHRLVGLSTFCHPFRAASVEQPPAAPLVGGGLGAGMCLLVHLAQPVRRDVRVDLRGGK